MDAASRFEDDGDGQRKACVFCRSYQPDDGKLLACFHVICVACLKDQFDRAGEVKCPVCSRKTSNQAGVELATELVDSKPVLYPSEPQEDCSTANDTKFCDPCQDVDIEKQADYECIDCGGVPLCHAHADRHPKKTRSLGHKIERLPGGRGGQALASSQACTRHRAHDVIAFCPTCEHCLCEKCINSADHHGHAMESLPSAAAKRRESLSSVLESSILGRPSEDGGHNSDETLAAIERDIKLIEEEAGAASSVVCESFDRISLLLRSHRERLLCSIDRNLWTKLEPLQSRRQKFNNIKSLHSTIVEISQRFVSAEVSDTAVLRLADSLLANMEIVEKAIAEDPVARPRRLRAAKSYSLEAVECALSNVVRLEDTSRINIASADVLVPESITVGKNCRIVIKLNTLPDNSVSSGSSLPEVRATVSTSASCEQEELEVPVLASVSENEVTMEVTVPSPAQPGKQFVKLSCEGAIKKASVLFTPQLESFDASKCSPSIILCDNGREASGISQLRRFGNVVGAYGFTKGVHAWTVRLTQCWSGGNSVGVGIASVPRNGDYSSTKAFFGEESQNRYWWWGTGLARKNGESVSSAQMMKWKNGDTLQLTVDCGAKSLQCINSRSGEQKVIENIDTSVQLFPVVCIIQVGQLVSLQT